MRVVPFDVPGHKRGKGNPELTSFLGQQCMDVDVNSMKPLDNLCHPVSVIREAEELAADGKNVSYRVVDFSKPEGKDEAKKYEIAWTSLLLIRHDAGDKETVRNISKFAIENARTNTEKFRKQLAEDIGKLLKE